MILTKNGAIKSVSGVTVVFSLVSAYTTYLGAADMIDPSKPWYFHIIPWGVAIVAFLFATVMYIVYCNVFPVATKTRQIALAVTIPLFIFTMFCMSTMLSVIGFGGDAAMQFHLSNTIRQADAKLNKVTASLGREQELAMTLQQLSQQFQALSSSEAKGLITKLPGVGETTVTLETIARVFADMRQVAAANKEEIFELNSKGTKIIGQLRDINQSGVPLGEKVTKFATKLNEFNALLTHMQALSVVKSIKAVSGGLDKLVLQNPEPSTPVGKAQQGAMPKVVALVASAKKILAEESAELISEAVQVEALNMIDIGAAIFEYAPQIKVAWGAALAGDFGPLLFIATVMIAWPFLRESAASTVTAYDRELYHYNTPA